jgi:hypothetical protein
VSVEEEETRFIYQSKITIPDMLLRASLLVKVSKGGHTSVPTRVLTMRTALQSLWRSFLHTPLQDPETRS